MLQPKTKSDALTVLQLLWEGAMSTPSLSLPCGQPDLSSHAQGIQASMVGWKEGMNRGADGPKALGME